jgi:succinate dehydrogenase hydrophobic anchor subunit
MRKKGKTIMTKTEMQIKKFKKSDNAVVGIFTVVLIISLIIGVVAVVNTVYVPQWMKQAEFQHMNQVSNQFAQLKYALDIQSITNGSSAIGSLVTMGTIEIPFLGVHQSFDELSIPSKSCILSIANQTGFYSSYTTDSIKFTSHNTNFVDQSYIYEAGTLILDQAEESVLLARPSILATQYGENLSITFINTTAGTGSNNFASGRGTFPIYSQIIQNNKQYTVIHNVTNITIQTDYSNAWYQVFNASLLYSGINHTIIETVNGIIVDFTETGREYNILIREIKISIDLAFGLIE